MKKKTYGAKRLLMLVTALLVTATISAADYLVYSVVGTAKIYEGSKTVALNARKTLTTASKLVIGKESAVTVIDEVNSKMYSFTTEGTNTVSALLKAAKAPKNLSKQYLSYMVKQLFSKESKNLSHPSSYMQATATSYRATSRDSFLLNRLASMAEVTASVESSLIQPKNLLSSDLDVRFDLVSCETGEPINPEVDVFTNCYVRVTNRTEEPLYVNVLDIDERGNKYLVLPVDEAATCAHLLVLHFDGASMQFDEALCHSQADARSFMTCRIDLIEVFEDALDVLHVDAGTRVRDPQEDAGVRGVRKVRRVRKVRGVRRV